MDLKEIEEAMKKTVESMDRGARLEAVLEEEDEFRLILWKGNHSDRAVFSKELLEGFVKEGRSGHEVKKIIGRTISKLNRVAQKRG